MLFSKIKKFLVAATIVELKNDEKSVSQTPYIAKSSELPVYVENEKQETRSRHGRAPKEICEVKPTALENCVSSVRKSVWSMLDTFRHYKQETQEIVGDAGRYVESTCNYLARECDDNTRYGAIGLSAATGLVLALRCGIIRRVLYPTITGGGMAAVCYPDEAKEYSEEISAQTRKYYALAMKYYYGETSEPSEISLDTIEQEEKTDNTEKVSEKMQAVSRCAECQ